MGCRGKQATVATSTDDMSSRPEATHTTPATYVGDASCAECHEDISQQYQEHSMGRSLTPVARAENVLSFTNGAKSVFTADGFRYQVVQQDGKLIHRQSRVAADGGELAVIEEEVQYTIGSGHHGRSYVVDHDGYLFMSPITW